MTRQPTARRRSPLVRAVLVVATVVAAWHIFASFLWIAPPSPLREVVPAGALKGYMLPVFGQSWSVFAPEPINGSYTLEVRAIVEEGGADPVETEWVDATAAEVSMAQYNLFPPRAAFAGTGVASALKSGFDDLTDDHQVIAGLNYFEADWENRMAEKMKTYGEPDLVDAYLPGEHMATAYATQVALAVWGDDVVRVQYRVTRQNVVPFASRHDPDATPPAPQVVETGWRGLVRNPGQSDAAFRDVFLPAYERTTEK